MALLQGKSDGRFDFGPQMANERTQSAADNDCSLTAWLETTNSCGTRRNKEATSSRKINRNKTSQILDNRIEVEGVERSGPLLQLMDRGANLDPRHSGIEQCNRESVKIQRNPSIQAARHPFSPRNQLGEATSRTHIRPVDLKSRKSENTVVRKSLPLLGASRDLQCPVSNESSSIRKLEADFGKLEKEYLVFLQKANCQGVGMALEKKTASMKFERIRADMLHQVKQGRRSEALSLNFTGSKLEACGERSHFVERRSTNFVEKIDSGVEEVGFLSSATPPVTRCNRVKGHENARGTPRSPYSVRGRIPRLEESTIQGRVKAEQRAKSLVDLHGVSGIPSLSKHQPLRSSAVTARPSQKSIASLSRGPSPRTPEMSTKIVRGTGMEVGSERKSVIGRAKSSIGSQPTNIGNRLFHSESKAGAPGSTKSSKHSHTGCGVQARSGILVACKAGSKAWR